MSYMVDADVRRAREIVHDIRNVLNEPGWTHEQWQRVRDKAQELIPIKDKWENEPD